MQKVAEAIAARRGLRRVDEASMLLAAISWITHRRAFDRWRADPSEVDPGEIITEEFRVLSVLFQQYGSDPFKNSPTAAMSRRFASRTRKSAKTR
jgi:hypothetical protein